MISILEHMFLIIYQPIMRLHVHSKATDIFSLIRYFFFNNIFSWATQTEDSNFLLTTKTIELACIYQPLLIYLHMSIFFDLNIQEFPLFNTFINLVLLKLLLF